MKQSGGAILEYLFDYSGDSQHRSPGHYTLMLLAFLTVSLLPLVLHLDRLGFIEDEGIRNLVALEMELSGNYIAPTLYGEFYLNKPPLWNWILILTYKITGGAGIFNARLATVFFLLVFCLTIYYGLRKHTGARIAFLNALMMLTCGRILFWDSMFSLIDICFSWVIFCLFLWIYHFNSNRRYFVLFTGAYAIATIGFFLKGLPALVFLGLTLAATLVYSGKWKKLISLEHLVGFVLSATITGIYFLSYSRYNPYGELIGQYFIESTMRTAAHHGILETVRHLVSFPVEMLYHFFPWSLLVVFFFSKHALQHIKKQPFLAYCLLVFAANIWVYWTSPNVFPRYLFMFLPLLTAPGVYLYFQKSTSTMRMAFDIVLILFSLVFIAGSWAPLWIEDAQIVQHIILKSSLLTLLFIVCMILLIRMPSRRLLVFSAAMLIVRLGFDLFVIPPRAHGTWEAKIKESGLRIAEKYKDEELHILRFSHLNYDNGFYLTNARQQILQQTDTLVSGSYMIVEESDFKALESGFEALDTLRLFEKNRYAYIIRVP